MTQADMGNPGLGKRGRNVPADGRNLISWRSVARPLGLLPTHFWVECRDTLTGEIITANEVSASGAALTASLPHFAEDIAAKIKPM